MATVTERTGLDFERLWGFGVAVILVALVGGSLAFPRAVYDGFVWHYFWGLVQVDANPAVCAVRAGGVTRYPDTASAYTAAAESVAYPGYTLVSEVGYMVMFIITLSGVVFLLRRLDIGERPRFFYALFPFMLFGDASRVVEDTSDTSGVAGALVTYPLNTPVISPVIYVTVFVITFVAAVGSVLAERRDLVDDYVKPLFGAGLAVLAVTLSYLLWAGLTDAQGATSYPQVLVVILVDATLTAAATWWLVECFAPEVNEGTGYIGLVVIRGRAIDGVANVIGLDWMTDLGTGHNLIPKHPVNQAVVDFTFSTLSESMLAVTGDAWPFLLIKLVAATAVVWMFDEQIFEDSPHYAILLLIAALAAGLGPGGRDIPRATFGV